MSVSIEVALPARWGRLQRLKNTLLYWAVLATAALIRSLPLRLVRPLGWLFGNFAYLVTFAWHRPWLKQIELALGPAVKKRRILRRMFTHLATSALELGHLEALAKKASATPGSIERLKEAARGGGAIVVSGHIGNWELLAQWGASLGLPIASVAKPLYDPRLTALVDSERSRHGLKLIWRGRDDGPLALMRALKDKYLLAMLIDQDTRVPGVFVPFFSRLAHTPIAPARLSVRRNVPLLVAFAHRVGKNHVINVEKLCGPKAANNKLNETERVFALLEAANRRLETAIRARPEQWVWLHRRWRRSPRTHAETREAQHA